MRHTPALLVVLVACLAPLTEENAPERTAQTLCSKAKRCDTDAWRDLYQEDKAECVDEQTEFWDGVFDIGGLVGLDLDLGELKNCLADIRKATCDDIDAGRYGPNCDDVLTF